MVKPAGDFLAFSSCELTGTSAHKCPPLPSKGPKEATLRMVTPIEPCQQKIIDSSQSGIRPPLPVAERCPASLPAVEPSDWAVLSHCSQAYSSPVTHIHQVLFTAVPVKALNDPFGIVRQESPGSIKTG